MNRRHLASIRKLAFTIAGIVILVLALAIYLISRERSFSKLNPSSTQGNVLTGEPNDVRDWKDLKLKPLSLNPAIADSLINPIIIRIVDKHIYVADQGDFRIHRFTMDGKRINTIGEGRGEGPGEVGNITDFFVRDEDIWVSSMRTRSILRFNIDGTYQSQFKTTTGALRVSGLGEHLMLLMMGGSDLFQQVDTLGGVVREFGQFVTDQNVNFLSLQGHFAATPSRGVVFAPNYASTFYIIDHDGNVSTTIQGVDGTSFPEGQTGQTETGTVLRAPEVDILYNVSNVEGDKIYMHTFFKDANIEESKSVLDVYSLRDGAYLHSMMLPEPIFDLQVVGNRLYTIGPNGVVAYEDSSQSLTS